MHVEEHIDPKEREEKRLKHEAWLNTQLAPQQRNVPVAVEIGRQASIASGR
jgi:hypothetical protein